MIQNAAHLHLIINHWPLFGIPLAAVILSWGEWKGGPEYKKIGFMLLIFSALMTGLVSKSGDKAEDEIEHMPGISESMIEAHEDAAEPAFILSGVTALLALAGLWHHYRKDLIPRSLVVVTLLLSLVTIAFMARAANLGGKIHHEEIR